MSTLDEWRAVDGKNSHRLNYDLNKESIVIDAGGYQGWFAENIHNKYKCKVYIFEPVKIFYDEISKKFGGNPDVKVFNFGLGAVTQKHKINIQKDGTSLYTETQKKTRVEEILIVNILEFLNEHKLKNIDLLKLNIEGEEFPLLEYLIKAEELNRFSNMQIQFHSFMDNANERRHRIRESLKESFSLEYDYPFVWEGWKQI